ncbi:MAG: hypothetical protein WDW36_003124 [Sanguina aurantia]
MASHNYKTVVLGGGAAAGYVAKAFNDSGKLSPNELLILGEESVAAYERPALSKAYLNPEGAPRLPGFHTTVGGGGEKQDPAWYETHGIKYLMNTKVTSVDIKSRSLGLEGGDTVQYEKLIIATGARTVQLPAAKVPGADLTGLFYLRNVADADALIVAMKAARDSGNKKVLVVGGGYIGLECTAGLVNNGLEVTVVLPEDRVLSRLFTPKMAAFYEDFYQKKGVTFVKGSGVTAFEGTDGKVTGVVVKTGEITRTIPAALVVVGVGARANVEIFGDQLELAAGGIKTNGQLQTSDPNVYAVGDVAAFPLLATGGGPGPPGAHRSTEEYDYLPFFYSRVFNLSWQFYGVSEGEVVHFGDFEAGKFGAYWVRDGKVVGAFLESGSDAENAAIKKVAATRPDAGSPEELSTAGVAFAMSKM